MKLVVRDVYFRGFPVLQSTLMIRLASILPRAWQPRVDRSGDM